MLTCSQCGFRIKEGGEKEAYMIRYTTGNIFESNDKLDKILPAVQKAAEKFKQWSVDKAKRFSAKYIKDCIQYLIDTNIVLKNLCGLYEVQI